MRKTRRNVITVFPSFVNRLRDNMKKMWYTFYPPFINRTYQFLRNALYTYARKRGQRHLIHTSIEHMYIRSTYICVRTCARALYIQSLNYSHIFHLCAHSTATLFAMQQSLLYSTASLMQHESYEGKCYLRARLSK